VRSVERACRMLGAFSVASPRLTLTQIAERAGGLPLPTAHRLAASLIACGFMCRAEDGSYELGFKMVELGAAVHDNLLAVRACADPMERIGEATQETVLLAHPEWSTHEIMIVSRRDSDQPLAVLSPVGQRSPIYPSSLGVAALAGLNDADLDAALDGFTPRAYTSHTQMDLAEIRAEVIEARELGYAVVERAYLEGVSGVAVPVLWSDGHPRATLGVVGPTTRLGRARLDEIGAQLLRATAHLSTSRAVHAPAAAAGAA
jgi:DNA-binding IclR family transcriptional regulator